MSETDSEDRGNKASRRAPGRRAKPPVTIDLAAEPASAGESASTAETAPEAAGDSPFASAMAETPAAAEPAPAIGPSSPTPSRPEPPPAEAAAPPPLSGARPISPFPPRVERPKTDWSSAGRLIAAGVFGGAIATVLGILYHASGIIPTRADLTAADAVRQAQAVAEKVAAFDDRLRALESSTAGLAALTEKVSSLEKLEDVNRSRIENLENAMPVAGSGDGGVVALGPLEARMAAAEASLASIGDRLDALGSKYEELAARPPPAVESERAARAIAIGLLRQGADSGQPFAADLAMLRALGLDGEDIAALEPLAKTGAPTIPALQAAFPSVVDAIIAATTAVDPDAGFLDQIAALGSTLVTIRPTTPIEGDTPAAIVSRMQAAVNRADLAAALDERGKLPAEGLAASASWAKAAADHVAIDAIIERLALSVTPPAN